MKMKTTIAPVKRKVMAVAALAVLLAGVMVIAYREQGPPVPDNLLPVAAAKDGHTAEESYRYRAMFSSDAVFNTREGFRNFAENVYYNLHWEDVHAVNIVRRGGAVWELPYAPDNNIGEVTVKTPAGMMPLDEVIVHEKSRIQGFIVVHKGKIVYEKYPGMDENDNHIWYSVSKTLPATILSILEAQGRVSVNDPVDKYLARAEGTHWKGIRIIDVMDMASGLDLAETVDTMLNEDHKVNKYFRISIGGDKVARDDNGDTAHWTIDDLMYAIDDKEDVAPGTIFEYSSLNTAPADNAGRGSIRPALHGNPQRIPVVRDWRRRGCFYRRQSVRRRRSRRHDEQPLARPGPFRPVLYACLAGKIWRTGA